MLKAFNPPNTAEHAKPATTPAPKVAAPAAIPTNVHTPVKAIPPRKADQPSPPPSRFSIWLISNFFIFIKIYLLFVSLLKHFKIEDLHSNYKIKKGILYTKIGIYFFNYDKTIQIFLYLPLTKSNFMKIGKKLKTLRTSKGYTPDFVSEKIGVSKTTYGRYERDESTPDINILENIANLYELEMFELLSDEKIILTQKNKKGNKNGLVINHISEKLIEQFEKRIIEKEEKIKELKEIILELKSKNK